MVSDLEIWKLLEKDIEKAKTPQERARIIEEHKDVFDNMSARINAMIESGEYSMKYQPHFENGKCTGAEALFRMNVDGVPLNPFVVFAVLRHYGYEKDATLKILDDMCDDINRLSKGKSDEFVVSYNVNPDFYDREYCNKILEILDAHNVNHSNFAVELLEVSSLENVKAEDMLYMKEHGIKTYLDDFGTGFATKSALKLPFSVVKIDGSLVENCDENEKKQRVLAEIVKICASKGMKTLAEKVEEKSELDVLTNIGINKFQGYYYDAGLSADDFLKRDYMHLDENMSF